MPSDLSSLDWTDLLRQIRHHPDAKIRQEAAREATARIWDGPNQPENRVPMSVFEPDC